MEGRNNWHNFSITDLTEIPKDFFIADLEIQAMPIGTGGGWRTSGYEPIKRRKEIFNGDNPQFLYRCRYVIPTLSHKEIMAKWWKIDGPIWMKVHSFNPKSYLPYNFKLSIVINCSNMVGYSKKDFLTLESADIPPEA